MTASKSSTGLAGLPPEIKLNIASFCPYSTVLALERTCRAFYGSKNNLALVRQIAETVYHSWQFSNGGIWSAIALDLQQVKTVCTAVEMALNSEGKSAVAIKGFLTSRIILAIHSHPLSSAVDLNVLQFCLHVARYYKLDDVIPDLAFCLIAATLGRGALENHFSILDGVTHTKTESLVVITFLGVNLHRDSLEDIQKDLPRPRLSLIPFETLLGELPSFMTEFDGMKYFTWRLQPLVSPSLLHGERAGVYLREWNTVYKYDAVRSVTKSGTKSLMVSATINQVPLDIESENFVMTPFRLVVFWEGASWLWKKERCEGTSSSAGHFPNIGHELDIISSSIELTLGKNFSALVRADGQLELLKDSFNLEDAQAMTALNDLYRALPGT